MFQLTQPIEWSLGFQDATILGWTTTVGYFLAMVLCGRAAQLARRSGSRHSLAWSLMAVLLFFFGVNKQFDLQTLLLRSGGWIAARLGRYQQRHAVQVVLVAAFAAALVAISVLILAKGRAFLPRDPVAWVGTALLVAFVFIRTAVLLNVNRVFGMSLVHNRGTHWMELAAVLCLAWAALRAARRLGREQPQR